LFAENFAEATAFAAGTSVPLVAAFVDYPGSAFAVRGKYAEAAGRFFEIQTEHSAYQFAFVAGQSESTVVALVVA